MVLFAAAALFVSFKATPAYAADSSPIKADVLKNSIEIKAGVGYVRIPFISHDARATNLNNSVYEGGVIHASLSYQYRLLWVQVKYMQALTDYPEFTFKETPFSLFATPVVSLGLATPRISTSIFDFDLGIAAAVSFLNYKETYKVRRFTSKLGVGGIMKLGFGIKTGKHAAIRLGAEADLYYVSPQVVNLRSGKDNNLEQYVFGFYPYLSFSYSF